MAEEKVQDSEDERPVRRRAALAAEDSEDERPLRRLTIPEPKAAPTIPEPKASAKAKAMGKPKASAKVSAKVMPKESAKAVAKAVGAQSKAMAGMRARKAGEAEAMAVRKAAEVKAARKAAEVKAARKKAVEEEARKVAELAEQAEAVRKAAEVKAARKKAVEEEARKPAEEDGAGKVQAARQKAAELKAARQKAQEEEAALAVRNAEAELAVLKAAVLDELEINPDGVADEVLDWAGTRRGKRCFAGRAKLWKRGLGARETPEPRLGCTLLRSRLRWWGSGFPRRVSPRVRG